jgi:TPR repeat protein
MKLRLFASVTATTLLASAGLSGQVQKTGPTRISVAGDTDTLPVPKEARKDTPATVTELKRRAESGDPIAQDKLGYLYTFGQGVPQDYEMAAKWYAAAAAQGLAGGQYNLGALYEHGLGVQRDYEEAVRNYRAAAEQGHVLAQARMGLLYEHGRGVSASLKEAMKWYRVAAEQGDPTAQCKVGYGY